MRSTATGSTVLALLLGLATAPAQAADVVGVAFVHGTGAQTNATQDYWQPAIIDTVRQGRGKALKETKDMYSGLFWTGDDAVKLGLVDDLGSTSYVAREVIGAEEIVDYTFRENVFDRFARRIGTAMAQTMSAEILGRAPVLK